MPLTAGYNGTLNTSVKGLAQSTVTHPRCTTTAHPFDANNPATSSRRTSVDVTVPAGTALARFATFAEDYPAGMDVDIFVYQNVGGTLHLSRPERRRERVGVGDVPQPASGRPTWLFVNVFAAPGGDGIHVDGRCRTCSSCRTPMRAT